MITGRVDVKDVGVSEAVPGPITIMLGIGISDDVPGRRIEESIPCVSSIENSILVVPFIAGDRLYKDRVNVPAF